MDRLEEVGQRLQDLQIELEELNKFIAELLYDRSQILNEIEELESVT